MQGSTIKRLAVAPMGALVVAASAWAAFASGGAPLADAPPRRLEPQLVVTDANCDTNYVMVNFQSETCADIVVSAGALSNANQQVVFTILNGGDANGTVTIAPPGTPTMSCVPNPVTVVADGGVGTITCTTTAPNVVAGAYGFTATSDGTPSGVIVLPTRTV